MTGLLEMDAHLGLDSGRSRLDSIKENAQRSSELSLNQRLGFFLLSRKNSEGHGAYIYTGYRPQEACTEFSSSLFSTPMDNEKTD